MALDEKIARALAFEDGQTWHYCNKRKYLKFARLALSLSYSEVR